MILIQTSQIWFRLFQLFSFLTIAPTATVAAYFRWQNGFIMSGTFLLSTVFLFFHRSTVVSLQQLIDLATYDRPGIKRRFTLLYELLNTKMTHRLTYGLQTNELLPIRSSMERYPSAGWLEREVWDLFGVFFQNHLDLRRILTDYGFTGFPLRKDFPVTGFLESFYLDAVKRIIYQPVELSQEMRVFSDTTTQW